MTEGCRTLSERIQTEIARADEKLRALRETKSHEYEELQHRHRLSQELSERLEHDVIRPRMLELVSHFDNAEFIETEDNEGCLCAVQFKHTPRFPSSTTLRIGITHDAEVRNVLLIYDLEILPIFMQYERNDQLALPIDDADERLAARWIEDKLVEFVATYLQLEFVDQYQEQNLVTDPVARMRISKLIAQAQADYQGHTYYFLTEDNKRKFIGKPTDYVMSAQER